MSDVSVHPMREANVQSADEVCEAAKISRIERLQRSVSILLRFASESMCISVSSDVISKVTPLLRLQPSLMDEASEIALWEGCNSLTDLVRPTTLESARLAVELIDMGEAKNLERRPLTVANAVWWRNFCWVFFAFLLLVMYITTQGYLIALTTTIDDAKSQRTQIEFVQQQQRSLGTASNTPIAESLQQQLLAARTRLEATGQTMERLVRWAPVVPRRDKDKPGVVPTLSAGGMMSATNALKPAIDTQAIEVYARIWRDIVLGYLIPLLLGMIGAASFVIRQISDGIKKNTYAAANVIRDRIRIVQGAIIGTLAGVLVAAIDTTSAASEVSIPVVALIFGYNAESAFRAMDAVHLKVKSYLSASAQ